MTKRIVFAVMCTLLLLVIVMSCIVFHRFSFVFETLLSSPNDTQPSTSPTVTEPSQPTVPPETTRPTEATQPPTDPPEPTAPTEPVHTHTYAKTRTVAPTCVSYGYTVYACDCGKTEIPEEEMQDPIGHDYVAGDPVSATCTTTGSIPYTCSRCEDRYASKTEDALGHRFGEGITVLPTCTEEGYTAYTCSVCSHEEKENIVEAPGHTCEKWETVEEATDVKPGSEKSICTVCEEELTRIVPPTGELKITNGNGNGQVATKIDGEGNQYRHYIILVGTQKHPNVYSYSIEYHVIGGVLKYTYGPDGLTVIYWDKDRVEIQTTLEPYCDGSLVINSDGSIDNPEDDPVPPTDPTDPSQPTDPTQPTAPTDPSQPTDPTQPTAPTDPSQPTDPTQPTAPTDPSQPTDPTNPSQPTDPTDPSQATDPTCPSQPTDPTGTSQATDPTQATEATGGAA